MAIKKALDQSGGDKRKAREVLKSMSAEIAQKKSTRSAKSGMIEAYSHADRIGVLIEVNCETDFVARNFEFRNFVHDLALQIASMDPKDLKQLLKQPFIKDESITIKDLLEAIIGKLGENIIIKRFLRYELGE